MLSLPSNCCHAGACSRRPLHNNTMRHRRPPSHRPDFHMLLPACCCSLAIVLAPLHDSSCAVPAIQGRASCGLHGSPAHLSAAMATPMCQYGSRLLPRRCWRLRRCCRQWYGKPDADAARAGDREQHRLAAIHQCGSAALRELHQRDGVADRDRSTLWCESVPDSNAGSSASRLELATPRAD